MSSKANLLAGYLRAANRILVFTGAGVSTGSGIPDYRGPQGVWTRRKPVYYHEFLTSEAARAEYWDLKLEEWEAVRNAKPNPVHAAIVALERAGKLTAVLTQNIDGLHALAGTSPERLIELHGTNRLVKCQSCHALSTPAEHFEFFRIHRRPPVCACGGFLKSATISFGQELDPKQLERALEVSEAADLVMALGSTLSVHPAAMFPYLVAQRGVPYVVINRGTTEHDGSPYVRLRLDEDVAETFPLAVELALR